MDRIVERWEMLQQSGADLQLDQQAWNFRFYITLPNYRPPANRNAQRVGVMTKKTMYVRSIYNEWYTHTNALKRVPDTAEELCWPMAFLGCEVRRLNLSEDKRKVIDVCESKGEFMFSPLLQLPANTLYHHIPIPEDQQELGENIARHCAHFVQKINDQWHLVIFNPYKISKQRVNNRYEYYLDEAQTMGQLDMWIAAAKIIHTYVELEVEKPVNVHHFGECGEAYAKVFGVFIHILRVECQLEQTHLFSPPEDLEEKHMDHIYLVFGDGDGNPYHCHTVTHRRKMLHKGHSNNNISIANYCDFCFKTWESKNQSKAEGLKHMSECRAKFCIESDRHVTQFSRNEYYDKVYKNTLQFKFSGIKDQPDSRKCNLCNDVVLTCNRGLEKHKCCIPLPTSVPEKPIPELQAEAEHPNLWVYDIESAQVPCEDTDREELYIHIPNCICLRPVYLEGIEDKFYFPEKDTFVEFLLREKRFEGATIYAHNGGAYDHQFVLQYLEKNCIEYSALPRPGSAHKYLDLTIIRGTDKDKDIHFKDFFVFMPYSLKQIAKSFDLPIQKGDFPHGFNKPEHEQYIGALPYFKYYNPDGLKSESDKLELHEWYVEQTRIYCTCYHTECICHKKKWNFQEEIQKYCWLDTDILAQSIAIFRAEHIKFGEELVEDADEWQPTSIDPLNYMTQAGAALHFFLQGHQASNMKMRPAITERRLRSGYSKKSILWLEEIMRREQIFIQHAGNSAKEYYDARATLSYVDGHSFDAGEETVYEFLGCFWHGCPRCHADKIQSFTQMHPVRNIPWKVIYDRTIQKIQKLETTYKVVALWECAFEYVPSEYNNELMNLIDHREMFSGGRTEVFSPYARTTSTDVIHYHDVTSMYPAVCASKMMPTGHPQIIFGVQCDMRRLQLQHPDRYFGYVRCRVVPNTQCVLGLLPEHKDNKLIFDLYPKIGVWFSEELYLAMQHGYQVTHIYEVYHFDEHNRSDKYFRGYMSFFMRIKQESEGWKKAGASSNTPSVEEQQQVIERLYRENNGLVARMRPERVAKNEVRRALAKLNLNCLWGKFGQNDDSRTQHKILSSYDQWVKGIYKNVAVDQTSIRYRRMNGGAFMCYYREQQEHVKSNAYVNIWICSAVTAWSRIILHTQMLKVGPEKVLYCDTDSIVFLQAREDTRVFTSRGLGNWADEMEGDNAIEEFLALAPKTYMLVTRHTPTGIVKAKGVRMNISNQFKTTKEILRVLLEEYFVHPVTDGAKTRLYLDHMTIFSNSMNSNYEYATVFTRYAKKILQVVISKRMSIPFPAHSLASLLKGDIDRLYTAPFSPRYFRDHLFYGLVYDKYM